jgi:hypothetical protein
LDRPGNKEIQLALFHDYQNNSKQYPIWQEYFRKRQPPTLVAWGKNDIFFGPQGALAFQRDIKDVEVHCSICYISLSVSKCIANAK